MTVSHTGLLCRQNQQKWGKWRQHGHRQNPADLSSFHPRGASLTPAIWVFPQSLSCVPTQPGHHTSSQPRPLRLHESPLKPTTMYALRPAHPAGLWTLSAPTTVRPQGSTPEPGPHHSRWPGLGPVFCPWPMPLHSPAAGPFFPAACHHAPSLAVMPHPWHDPAITNAHSGHSGPRGWPAPPSLPTCLQLAPAAERVHTTSSGNHHNRQVLFQQQLLDVNVNDWIFQSKGTKHLDGQRNMTQSYVAYERLVLTLRAQTGSMWRHRKRYSMKMETERKQR